MRFDRLIVASLAVLTVSACIDGPDPHGSALCTPATFTGAFDGEVTLCQNWNASDQQQFWFLDQGSQVMPYRWFLALEQAGSETLFRDDAHMDGFRYLPQQASGKNPDGLPIGFTKGEAEGNEVYEEISDEWLGLTCAACHTGQIEFNGQKMLIDGAPTMADFEGFMQALVESLQATLDDGQKFDRFATRVLESDSEIPAAKGLLREQLEEVTRIRTAWNRRNQGDHPYGFARLDAIGAIFNEVTAGGLGIPANARPANAPVSYPFLWDTPQHDRVQWNGSVENSGAGALGRNVGEVLGVFGSLTFNTKSFSGHKNSVNIRNLGELEALVSKLQSPQWPEIILPAVGASDETLAKGRDAFVQHCSGCHAGIDRDDPKRRVTAVLTSLNQLGTDPRMAANFANRVSESGRLKGRVKTYIPVNRTPELFGDTGSGVEFLRNAVTGVIVYRLTRDVGPTLNAISAGREIGGFDSGDPLVRSVAQQSKMAGTAGSGPTDLAYKARPLNGIWATAPYLHNGSVRTMRQMLLPAAQRQSTFHVGSREYDPEDMGFVDEGGYLFDTSLPGNSNAGHEGPRYGTDQLSTDAETLEALLDYLKTL